jgi:arylsulfatase A-like enzyme
MLSERSDHARRRQVRVAIDPVRLMFTRMHHIALEGVVKVLRCTLVLVLATGAWSCRGGSGAASPGTIRLVDLFKPEVIQGSVAAGESQVPRIEWRFDRPAQHPAPAGARATQDFQGSPGVQGLAIRGGRLTGRSGSDTPVLMVRSTADPGNRDQFHAIELRLRASAGGNLLVAMRGPDPLDLAAQEKAVRRVPGALTSPIVAGPEFRTYTLTSPAPLNMSRVRQILIVPTDAAGATFEIESIRIITRREHLAGLPSGVAWQGLGEIYRESLVARSPEAMTFEATLPDRPWLDLAVGTVDDQPATFRVALSGVSDTNERVLLEHTVSTPYRWDRQRIDLGEFAGRQVRLKLAVAADSPGVPGLWGAPVIRSRTAAPRDTPQGVILIQADTLRPDHLGLYGHTRDTAPFLGRMAAEGAVFRQAFAQAGWTKVSTPSIMTSLYPSTHGVLTFDDRVPASATTLGEVYREAGYATLSLSSVMFSGQYTNLHQGFEELHELTSVPDSGGPYSSKTAREYVDRATEWIERHRDGPFFLYLHVFDPHSPYEPRRPYDTMWADPAKREAHIRERESLRKTIADPFLAVRGMATREEMLAAGLDPAAYLAHDKDWYDSSIRGLDAEVARLFERLRVSGLDGRTAVVFLSDHGEEFQEHGRMWHGQSAYGEMMRVPLVVRWPEGVTAGRVIEEPVQLIDVMPTLLDFSRLPPPEGPQGQSLRPLLRPPNGSTNGDGSADAGWRRRPVIMEKQPMGQPGHPAMTESYAILDGGWKLIHNKVRPPDRPEFELFDAARDPLDQTNVADKHPEVVQRLAKALEGWRTMAAKARLKPDAENTGTMTPEQLQRLRSLGYIR